MKQLAIIIPAYKVTFFRKAVASIAAQTCKDFTLYVGNDNSSDEIENICNEYSDKIDIRYHKFSENLGGHDLVAQWERCIDLSEGEPWIWLFSDDDMMSPDCVECFYEEIRNGANFDIYHVNVDVVDEEDNIIRHTYFPPLVTSRDFLRAKLQGRISSYVVEYIFNRQAFMSLGRFQKFDMAWSSDDATWIKLSLEKGIKTIEGECKVKWRKSGENISPNNQNVSIVKRKIAADIEYTKWIFHTLKLKPTSLSLLTPLITWMMTNYAIYSKAFDEHYIKLSMKDFFRAIKMSYAMPFCLLYYQWKKKTI